MQEIKLKSRMVKSTFGSISRLKKTCFQSFICMPFLVDNHKNMNFTKKNIKPTSWINARNLWMDCIFFLFRSRQTQSSFKEWLPRTTLIHDNYSLNIGLMQFIRIQRIISKIMMRSGKRNASEVNENVRGWIAVYN